MLTVTRYHDFSCAHRSASDPGKCSAIHGHNYRVHFFVKPRDGLTPLGRVIDFSVIKTELCEWLEHNWDHKLLIWTLDPLVEDLSEKAIHSLPELQAVLTKSIRYVPFDTSTENMAQYLLDRGPDLLPEYAILYKVKIEETRKCGAEACLEGHS